MSDKEALKKYDRYYRKKTATPKPKTKPKRVKGGLTIRGATPKRRKKKM